MHVLQRIIAVAAVAVAGFVAVPLSAATALPSSDPTFDSITWGHDTLVASGTAMVLQTGSVHVTDPRSQPPAGCWYFRPAGSGGTGTMHDAFVRATLTSGTSADGVWTFSFYLPSTADGTWTLPVAEECSATSVSGFHISSSPTFTVTGHHQPRLSWGYSPDPVRAANPVEAIKGRVYDADTGAGMTGVTVGRNDDVGCLWNEQGDAPAWFGASTKTGASGYFAMTDQNASYGGTLECIGLRGALQQQPDGNSAFVYFHLFRFRWVPAVSAAPTTTRVPVGTVVTVPGKVVGGYRHCAVELQRLHGSTAWRTVSTAQVRDSLRFTLTAQPLNVGANVYRAFYPNCATEKPLLQLAASSTPFTITGS